jgi:hypothetical protein
MTFVGKEFEGITMTEENCEFAKQHTEAIFAIYKEFEWHCDGSIEEVPTLPRYPCIQVWWYC